MINKEITTLPNINSSTNDTVTVNQFISSSPSLLSQSHYNTLKFNYDTECNLPSKAYDNLPIPSHEDIDN